MRLGSVTAAPREVSELDALRKQLKGLAHMAYDLAIIGSSFTGSLLAALARRLGKSVVILERGHHPRFAIGESSTPLANLLLEELSDRYALPWLRPFSKWGTWQAMYPELPCGLKRGFSFFFHQPGAPWVDSEARENELRVAASPHDAIADTHWYRPDFDARFVEEARRAGADYVDEIELSPPFGGPGAWNLLGVQRGGARHFSAKYLVDASGPRGYLSRAWALEETTDPGALGSGGATQALFTHFQGVARWESAATAARSGAPFPADDAALHHVFPGGWIWVLRFNQGITSAGCAVTSELAEELGLSEGAPGWERLLRRLPSVAAQFAGSQPVRPFIHLPRLAYRSRQIVGSGWCLLPGTAGFIDPLLSTGFVLNLLGIQRLLGLWERGESPDERNYGAAVAADLSVTADLVAGLYRWMPQPEGFKALGRLYFAAASFSETVRRMGKPELAPGFLLREEPRFAAGFAACLEAAGKVEAGELLRHVRQVIANFDVAGLGDSERRNWFGCDAADLYAAGPRLGFGREEIRRMLVQVGFC